MMSQQASQNATARTQPRRNPIAPVQRPLRGVRGQHGQPNFPMIAPPGEDGSVQPGARAGTILLYTLLPIALLVLAGRCVGLV